MIFPYPPSPGCTERVHRWWAGVIAGEPMPPTGYAVAPELLSKLRLLEGLLGPLCRLLGLGQVRTLADLLPDNDELTCEMLNLFHDWTGAMLALDPELARVRPVELGPPPPAEPPA